MSELRRGQKSVIRLLALGLFFLSVQRGGAGIWVYRGGRALRQENFEGAIGAFQRAQKWDSGNPQTMLSLGQSAWQQGLKKGEKKWFQMARSHLENLTKKLPYYGRGWVYLALARLNLELYSENRLTRSEWREIADLFQKAHQYEPGNAWISYRAGIQSLSQRNLLTDSERKKALDEIKKVLRLHYPEHPSRYLDPALSFLWSRFLDFDLLKEVTPEDAVSYQSLIHFLERNNLWQYRGEIYGSYLKFRSEVYEAKCREGEQLLEKGSFKRAFIVFQRAYWVEKSFLRAKAGMLIAQEAMNQLPADYGRSLREILEGEEDMEGLLPYLEKTLRRTQDSYLRGLYAFRIRNFRDAYQWLQEAPPPRDQSSRRRILALCLWELGKKNEAFTLLEPALGEENPDLRELALLEDWGISDKSRVLEKINQVASTSSTKDRWWGEGSGGILGRGGRMQMGLNLKPGPVLIEIQMRSVPDKKNDYAYAVVRLGREIIGTAYVAYSEWHPYRFRPEGQEGGKKRLSVELFNGPPLELGDVKIHYLS